MPAQVPCAGEPVEAVLEIFPSQSPAQVRGVQKQQVHLVMIQVNEFERPQAGHGCRQPVLAAERG